MLTRDLNLKPWNSLTPRPPMSHNTLSPNEISQSSQYIFKYLTHNNLCQNYTLQLWNIRHLKHQKTQQTLTSLPPKVSHHILLLILLLQLCEISLDPGVAGQQVLGCIQNLFSLTAGQQQLVGTLPHSHLKVKLFLYAGVLHRPQIRGSQMIHCQYRQ